MVPLFEPSKKVVPLFEREKRWCHYLIITLKVVPLFDVYPYHPANCTLVDNGFNVMVRLSRVSVTRFQKVLFLRFTEEEDDNCR